MLYHGVMPIGKYAITSIMLIIFIIGEFAVAVEHLPQSRNPQVSSDGLMSSLVGVEDRPPTNDGLWVEVETVNLLPSDITGIYLLIPYRNRREKWGQTISVGMAQFTPVNYQPSVSAQDFQSLYGVPNSPMLELQYTLKRNIALGSIGLEAGYGFYNNDSDDQSIASNLSASQLRLGANLYLDNLTYEPYVVPYASIGAYMMQYEEALAATTFGGTTGAAMYYTVGLQFQLDWIDKEAGRIAYIDYGIENTFFYIEARQHFTSSEAIDPDFSTGMDIGAGARLEF